MKKTVLLLSLMLFGLLATLSAQTVYVTSQGERYHKKDCQYVKGNNATAMTLAQAKAKGLTACSVCYGTDKAKPAAAVEKKKETVKPEIKKEAAKAEAKKDEAKKEVKKETKKADATKAAAKTEVKKEAKKAETSKEAVKKEVKKDAKKADTKKETAKKEVKKTTAKKDGAKK